MVNPIIEFTADLAEPDLYNDVNGLPNPFTMNILLGITNTHTATLYFKVSIVSAACRLLCFIVKSWFFSCWAKWVFRFYACACDAYVDCW